VNEWGFDWLSALIGAVGGMLLFVIGAFATGYFGKAGESAYKKTVEHFSPPSPEPKPPIKVRPTFDYAPDAVSELRQKYNREKYDTKFVHQSDRSRHEAEGWFAVTTDEGEEVFTIDAGETK